MSFKLVSLPAVDVPLRTTRKSTPNLYLHRKVTPLTEAALIDGDKDLQDARNGIGGDHVYLVTVAITSSESGPKNKRVVTLKADARYWDMYVKTGTSTVQTHEFTTWDTKYASDKKVTYQFKKELKTTTAKITTACKFDPLRSM